MVPRFRRFESEVGLLAFRKWFDSVYYPLGFPEGMKIFFPEF